MGSNLSEVISSFDSKVFDDSEIRQYLIDVVNDNPESFEEYEDEIERPYGPLRNRRVLCPNLWLSPWVY